MEEFRRKGSLSSPRNLCAVGAHGVPYAHPKVYHVEKLEGVVENDACFFLNIIIPCLASVVGANPFHILGWQRCWISGRICGLIRCMDMPPIFFLGVEKLESIFDASLINLAEHVGFRLLSLQWIDARRVCCATQVLAGEELSWNRP